MPVNPMALQAMPGVMPSTIASNPSASMGVITTFDSRELESLKVADDQQEALEKVAEQFESLFLQMVLKQMRKASEAMGDDDSMLRSRESKTYQEFFDGQISMEMAKRNTGLADVIVRQLSGTFKSDSEPVDLSQHSLKNDSIESLNNGTVHSLQDAAPQNAAFAQPLLHSLRKDS